MEVLVTLADANGAVLSRDDLMQACWRGVIVGDDAVNRTIGEIRRAVRESGAGFGIETIARVGYRLSGMSAAVEAPAASGGGAANDASAAPPAAAPATFSVHERRRGGRRSLLAAGIAATGAGLAIFVGLRSLPAPDPPEIDLGKAKQLMRTELESNILEAARLFEEAVQGDEAHAEAWGLLALAWAYAAEHDVDGAMDKARQAAIKARELQAGNPDAEVALILVDRVSDDWTGSEPAIAQGAAAGSATCPGSIRPGLTAAVRRLFHGIQGAE
jgi:DNA-binding winged helix-turn-helix (wHTH) protein